MGLPYSVTTTVPFMPAAWCGTHTYGYVPAFVNVFVQLCPGAMLPESKPEPVAVCVSFEPFFHVTL